MAYVLAHEILWLAMIYGVERLGFLTLTFADNVREWREAQRRFNSLLSHVLRKRYRCGVIVGERQKSGRVHFHLVVVLAEDIRSGADFAAFERREYRSANDALRAEWAFWRKTAPKYGFGRTELLPVKSNAEGIGRYVGKYVAKHVGQRVRGDKGARIVRFFGYGPGERKASCRMGWATRGGWLWRQKLGAFCQSRGVADVEQLTKLFGSRWAYHLADEIMTTELPSSVVYPDLNTLTEGKNRELKMWGARQEARDKIDALVNPREVKDDGRKFIPGPVWAVPNYPPKAGRVVPPPSSVVASGEERAREMRLYALRLPRVSPVPISERGRCLLSVQDQVPNSKAGASSNSVSKVFNRSASGRAIAGEAGADLQLDLVRVGLCIPSGGSLPPRGNWKD